MASLTSPHPPVLGIRPTGQGAKADTSFETIAPLVDTDQAVILTRLEGRAITVCEEAIGLLVVSSPIRRRVGTSSPLKQVTQKDVGQRPNTEADRLVCHATPRRLTTKTGHPIVVKTIAGLGSRRSLSPQTGLARRLVISSTVV